MHAMHVKEEEGMFLNLDFSFLAKISVAGWANWVED